MPKFIETSGNTVAEAIQKGLNDLDVSMSDVTTEIIRQPRAGFFGFGASKAVVRVTVNEEIVEVTPKVEKKEAPKATKAPKQEKTEKQKAPKVEKPKAPKTPKAPKVEGEVEQIKKAEKPAKIVNFEPKEEQTSPNEAETKAKEFVDGLMEKMNIQATAKVLVSEDKNIYLEIIGEGLGNVIGRRGDTLDAIQYITTLAIKDVEQTERIKVTIDCQNYRAKRRETLEKLALKMGHKVAKNKRNMTLEPMNPYERRIIHEVLQDFRGVHTYSTGKEPNRRVVVGFGEGKSR